MDLLYYIGLDVHKDSIESPPIAALQRSVKAEGMKEEIPINTRKDRWRSGAVSRLVRGRTGRTRFARYGSAEAARGEKGVHLRVSMV